MSILDVFLKGKLECTFGYFVTMQPAIFTRSFATREIYTQNEKRDVNLMNSLRAFFEIFHSISTFQRILQPVRKQPIRWSNLKTHRPRETPFLIFEGPRGPFWPQGVIQRNFKLLLDNFS